MVAIINRRLFSLLVVFALGLLFVGCDMMAGANRVPNIPEGKELISNGDFEIIDESQNLPLTHDRTYGGGDVYSDDTYARSGNYSVYIGPTDGAATGFGTNTAEVFYIEPGTYQISVWYKAPEILSQGLSRLPFYLRVGSKGIFDPDWIHPISPQAPYSARAESSTSTVAFMEPNPNANLDPDAWHNLLMTVTFGDENDRLILNMYNESRDYPIWIDDISIQKLD